MSGARPLGALAALSAAALLACAGAQRTPDARARRVRLELAGQLALRGDWPAAFAAADALVQEEPSDPAARLLRGTALRHQGLLAEAEADLRRAVAAEPRSAAAHGELAVLLEQVGRRDEALAEHEEAHRLAPGAPRFANDLAFAYVIRGEPRKAIPLLEAALREDPTSARLRNNLGFARAASGDFVRAELEFGRAGSRAQARNNLGLAYERAGDLEHAFELYLEAWRLESDRRFFENLQHAARGLGRELPPDVRAPRAPSGGS